MWWLIGSAPDRIISGSDPPSTTMILIYLEDHCAIRLIPS